MQRPTHHIFVCTSSRPTGQQKGFCHARGGLELMERLMEEIEERELGGEVVVTNTGCFGICEKGPILVVYPENVWYGSVTPDDIAEIMDDHIERGHVVEQLVLP